MAWAGISPHLRCWWPTEGLRNSKSRCTSAAQAFILWSFYGTGKPVAFIESCLPRISFIQTTREVVPFDSNQSKHGIIPLRDERWPGLNSPPAPNIIMLNELEFAYTPVRDKVRDLREYL
jgi:hypothetical protein